MPRKKRSPSRSRLREAVETPGKTAALVTPDRALARRVVAALERWQVAVDDSGGDALADTPAGVFARLAAEAALGGLEPVTLLALLKHPLLRLGAAAGAHAIAIATLERALLRGPRPRPGSDGLAHALATFRANRDQLHRSDPRWLIADDEFDVAAELIARLGAALAPLETLKPGEPSARRAGHVPPRRDRRARPGCRRRHRRLRRPRRQRARPRLRGTHRQARPPPALPSRKATMPSCSTPPSPTAWCGGRKRRTCACASSARSKRACRRSTASCSAASTKASGRPKPRSDPWLSRPMRRDLGLDPPERRIGLSAHDFAQALGAPEVILTRAAKVAGAPTVTSRFVQRIAALAGDALGRGARARRQLSRARPRARSSGDR